MFLCFFGGEVLGMAVNVMRETEGFELVGLWSLVIGMVWVERDWRGFSKSRHFWRCRSRGRA